MSETILKCIPSCLLLVMCIKCYCIHDNCESGVSVKCSLCDVVFYSEICMRNCLFMINVEESD